MNAFTVSSDLLAPPDVVWRHAVSPSGVNREMRPLLRMTFPTGVDDLLSGWQPGVRRFRSWLLLAGILPVEFDDVVFEEVDPGRRFLERSRMATQRVWEHERIVEPLPWGCRLTDRIHFEPRVRALAPLMRPVFLAVFRWRHRNLRRRFGRASAADPG